MKFSVIMVTYNHEKFIEKAILSVLKQDYHNLELVVINDGSTDETSKRLNLFNDERLIIINQDNQGLDHLPDTYNKALANCSGDYICILEGDDEWYEEHLSVIKTNINVACCLYWAKSCYINEESKIIGLSKSFSGDSTGDISSLIKAGHLYGNVVTPSPTIVFEKKSLLACGGFSKVAGVKVVDFTTAIAILSSGGKYQYIDICTGKYRRHQHQATQTISESLYKEHNIALKYFYDEKYSSEYTAATVWNDILYHFSKGNYLILYSYFTQAFKMKPKYVLKYIFLLGFGWLGRRKISWLREKTRGKI